MHPIQPHEKIHSVDIQVTVVRASNLPKAHHIGESSYCIALTVDGKEYRTTPSRKVKSPTWNEHFTFPASTASCLRIQVYCVHKHRPGEDHVIAELNEFNILKADRHADSTFDLFRALSAKAFTEYGSITIHLQVDPAFLASPDKLWVTGEGLAEDLARVGIVARIFQSDLNRVSPNWKRLMKLVGSLVEHADQISSLDARAKLAFGAVAFAINVVIKQIERDKKIDDLVGTMAILYDFLQDANPVAKILSFEKTVKRLVRQTIECAYFIAEYSRSDFMQRAVLGAVLNPDRMIAAYEASFEELKIEFVMGTTLQTAVTTFRILETVENIKNLIHLQDLPYMKNASWDSESICYPRTCVLTIDNITQWIVDGYSPATSHRERIYLLLGAAQCGKSSISHTIAERFYAESRLGSAIFLAREVEGRNKPHKIFSTMARQLAAFDNKIKEGVARAIDHDPDLPSASVKRQFEGLIVGPTRGLTIIGPILIVIDGIDECEERGSLLKILAEQAVLLPPNFRFLITSRPENDIVTAFNNVNYCYQRRVSVTDSSVTCEIGDYVTASLARLMSTRPKIFEATPADAVSYEFAIRSTGIHLWVSTACQVIAINSDDEAAQFLEMIISQPCPRNSSAAFHHLYCAILHIAVSRLNLNHPLGWRTFSNAPVLKAQAIRSLSDALPPWDPSNFTLGNTAPQLNTIYNGWFAELCFDAMNNKLAPDMCRIANFSLLNAEIPDLKARVEKAMPNGLRYACQYWHYHINLASGTNTLLDRVRVFLSEHLLHWVELLSLIGLVEVAIPSLKSLRMWLENHSSPLQKLVAMVNDAERFIQEFSLVISKSGLHTYISALTLTPQNSLLYQTYNGRTFPRQPRVISGIDAEWPPSFQAMQGHNRDVTSIAFSPDGSRIVSGSEDLSVRIWDVRTGKPLGPPLQGHTDIVTSVAFSPDGCQVASGSWDKTVRIWDVQTGSLDGEPLRGHKAVIESIAYSPDGSRVASGSRGWEIRIWDMRKREIVGEPVAGRSPNVRCVRFSPNGMQIATLSLDGTIQLWEAETGHIIGGPLEVSGYHSSNAWSISWSPDGRLLAVSSAQEVSLWDVYARRKIGNLPSALSQYRSLAFDRGGTKLAAGLEFGICIWDVTTHNDPSKWRPILQDDTVKDIWSVAFSPNGLQVASRSNTFTIHVWEVYAHTSVHKQPRGLEGKEYQPLKRNKPSIGVYAQKVDDDGWIRTSTGRRVLWVPASYHRGDISAFSDSLIISRRYNDEMPLLVLERPEFDGA